MPSFVGSALAQQCFHADWTLLLRLPAFSPTPSTTLYGVNLSELKPGRLLVLRFLFRIREDRSQSVLRHVLGDVLNAATPRYNVDLITRRDQGGKLV
jgi:hypothetical protein